MLRDPVATMRRLYLRHGDVMIFDLPLRRRDARTTILAMAPRHNRLVLGNPTWFRPSAVTLPGPVGSAQRRLRWGIVRQTGAEHRYYRKLFGPPMSPARVAREGQTIANSISQALDRWPLGEQVDLSALVTATMRAAALVFLFGGQRDEQAFRLADRMEAHVRLSGSILTVATLGATVRGAPFRRFLDHAATCEREIEDWAETRRHRPLDDKDLLSLLVHQPFRGERTPDAPFQRGCPHAAGLGGHMFTLFGASYETSRSTLTWILLLLALHPDILDRLRASLTDKASDNREGEDYLDRVLKEAMRVMTPVPYQVRTARQPFEMDGIDYRAGTRVILSPSMTNRNPAIYPEPERFDPDRWLTIAPSAFEYLVFSAGPRRCLGYSFAMAMLRSAVRQILTRFTIEVVDGQKVDRFTWITQIPRHGLKATLRPAGRTMPPPNLRGNALDTLDLPRA